MDPPAQPQGGGKKKKKQKKTMTLDQFLTNGTDTNSKAVFAPSSTSWADESENAMLDDSRWHPEFPSVDVSKLPKAPRSATESSAIDPARIPKRPPYTAYIGNLSYDITEDEILEFVKCPNANLRLPREGNRLKGFGYVEFPTANELVNAIDANGSMLRGRRIKLDIAEDRPGRGDDGMSGGGHYDDDRTAGDWRSGPPRDTYEPPRRSGEDRFDDRGGRGYEDRYEDRGRGRFDGPSRGGDDGYDRNRSSEDRFGRGRGRSPSRADEGSWRSSEPPRGNDRSQTSGDSRRDNDRAPYASRDDTSPRSGSRDHSGSSRDGGNVDRQGSDEGRQSHRPDDRSDGPDRGRDWHEDRRESGSRYDSRDSRGGYDSRGGSRGYNDRYERPGDRYNDRGGDRYNDRGGDRYNDRGGDRYNDRGGDRYNDRGGDRYNDRGGDRYNDRGGDRYSDRGADRYERPGDRYDSRRGSSPRRNDDGSRDDSPAKPAERPRLNLQKRSKPVEAEPSTGTQSSIFGGAKPVDTAAKERELETRKEVKPAAPKTEERDERRPERDERRPERDERRPERDERRTERTARPAQPEKSEVKSWRDAPKPETSSRNGDQKDTTARQEGSAQGDDPQTGEADDGWQEASSKRPQSRAPAGRRGSNNRDRRDDRGGSRGSGGGRRDHRDDNGRRDHKDEAGSGRQNYVPADPPAKSAWGGKPRPAPVVQETKKEWTHKNAFDNLEAEDDGN